MCYHCDCGNCVIALSITVCTFLEGVFSRKCDLKFRNCIGVSCIPSLVDIVKFLMRKTRDWM